MNLTTIFNALTFGELRAHSIGGVKKGGIQPEDYLEIGQHIDFAMRALYTRFPIVQKELLIKSITGQTEYLLTSEFAEQTVPQDPNWYIVDTVEKPFTDDILRVDAVYDQAGYELPIGDINHTFSVYLPTYRSIQIPFAAGGNYALIYRAKPVPVNTGDLDEEILLPDTLLEPLLSYVAYRVSKARGGEAGITESRISKAEYESQCQEIEKKNVLNTEVSGTNLNHDINGW